MARLFPTTLVGSYPQPGWLIDRARLSKMVPRVRMDDLWLPDPKELEAKQDEATLIAIRDQERAGLDIISDGEQRRESYSNRFATALEGVDTENPGSTLNRSGKPIAVPRVIGKIRRKYPVELRDLQFLRANTRKPVKMTVPGPFTMSKQAQNEFYASDEAMALDYAAAVNDEIKDLFAAGADVVQIDEPWMQQHPARRANTASRHSTARSTVSAAPSPCTCASAMPQWCTRSLPAIRSCLSSKAQRPCRFPLRRRSPSSISRCWNSCRRRPSSSVSSISLT